MENCHNNNDDRWSTCLTFMQDKCPNKEKAEKAFLWQEKHASQDFHLVTVSEIEEAKAYCRQCKAYIKYGN